MVRLLSLPRKERPRLVMAYFDEPDHMGHVYGPISAECKAQAEQMDSLMRVLYTRYAGLMSPGERQVLARVIRDARPESDWKEWLSDNPESSGGVL